MLRIRSPVGLLLVTVLRLCRIMCLSLLLFSRSVCLTVCDPTDCSTPGFPVLHHLLEFAQIHVHWVGDVIQLSHPLLPPFSPTFNLSQHQGVLKWVSSLNQVAKVLELQHQSFQLIQGWFPLGLPAVISLPSKGLSRIFSNTTVQKYQFFNAKLFYCPVLTSVHDYWKKS